MQSLNRQRGGIINLYTVRRIIVLSLFLAMSAQLFFTFNQDDIILAAVLFCSATAGLLYALRRDMLLHYPLSSLMILGYVATFCVIPLVGQICNFHPVDYNLQYPILDAYYITFITILVLAAHKLYRSFSLISKLRHIIVVDIFKPLNAFLFYDTWQLLLLGLFGSFAAVIVAKQYTNQGGGVFVAFMRGIAPLMFLPIVAIDHHLLYPSRCGLSKGNNRVLWLYSGVIVCLSFILNSRGILVAGFASFAVLYIYRILAGQINLPRITPRRLILMFIVLYVVIGPISQLMASIVIARAARSGMSSKELLEYTWSIFESGKASSLLAEINSASSDRAALPSSDYSELYYNNMILDRLANLKLLDNAAGGVSQFNQLEKKELQQIDMRRIAAIFPEPILRLADINVDKKNLIGSDEDFIIAMTSGDYSRIGNYLTGSLYPDARNDIGYIWPLVMILPFALVFAIVDAGCILLYADGGIFPVFSILTAGSLMGISTFLMNVQDVAEIVSVITRQWVQSAFVMWLCTTVVLFVTNSLSTQKEKT